MLFDNVDIKYVLYVCVLNMLCDVRIGLRWHYRLKLVLGYAKNM